MPKATRPLPGRILSDACCTRITRFMQQALHTALDESRTGRQVSYSPAGLAPWTPGELASVRELKAALASNDSPAFDDERPAAYWLALQFKIADYEATGLPIGIH